jgi:hypothetical protein
MELSPLSLPKHIESQKPLSPLSKGRKAFEPHRSPMRACQDPDLGDKWYSQNTPIIARDSIT